MRQVKRERMCEYPGRSCRRKKKCAVTTNGKKSAEAIVPEKNPERAEQSLVLSRFRKEVNMKNAEYQGSLTTSAIRIRAVPA